MTGIRRKRNSEESAWGYGEIVEARSCRILNEFRICVPEIGGKYQGANDKENKLLTLNSDAPYLLKKVHLTSFAATCVSRTSLSSNIYLRLKISLSTSR